MSAGRPFGLTPWRMARTQSTGLYAAVDAARSGGEVGRADQHALPSSTTTLAAAVEAVAVAAAARAEQVAAALDAGGVGDQRHADDGDVDPPLELAIAEHRQGEHRDDGDDDERRDADQRALDPGLHGSPSPLISFQAPIASLTPAAQASLVPAGGVEVRTQHRHQAEQRLGRKLGLHAADHRRALGRCRGRQHPARGQLLVGRAEAGQQPAVQLAQVGVAVVLPEQGVVHRLLDVHVLQVLGDEQRQVAIEAQRQRGGGVLRGAAQRRRFLAQGGDRLGVLDMLVGDLRRPGRLARLDRGVDEGVLVPQMVGAEAEQLLELIQCLVAVGRVGDVDPADPHQRLGHERAHRLVDAGVEIEARRSRARHGGA